jgi:tetratricopeptide (TPR) repeat protein
LISIPVVLLVLAAAATPVAAAQEDVPEVARQKLQDANHLREGGRSDDAIARYREVIELAPSLVEAYVGLGAVYHQVQDYENALKAFTAGLARYPDDATLLFNAAATEVKLEHFDAALSHADHALVASASDPALQTMRGTILRKLGRQKEAVEAFRKAAELDSKNARAQYNLGNVYYELGRKEEALESFRQAVKLDKGFQPAQYNLGAVLFELDSFDEALQAYESALAPVEKDFAKGKEVSAIHARAYLNLGAIYLKRQSWDRALDAYEKAAKLDPSLAAAHYNVGYIRYRMGQTDVAYEAYERAVKLDPELPLSYLHMGLIDFSARRMESAVHWFEQGLPKFTGDDRKAALLALAQAEGELGNSARAEESFRAVLKDSPDEATALVGLGRLLREQGTIAEARGLLEKASGVVLDSSGVALELAVLARAEGDAGRERALYQEALRRDGDRPEMWPVRVNLVAALVRAGDIPGARNEMEVLAKALPAIEQGSPAVARELRTAHALLLAREGNVEAARKELSAVVRTDASFAPAANGVAAIDATSGKLAEAAKAWSALASRPSGDAFDSVIRGNLGEVLWLQGRPDEAREHLLDASARFPRNALLRTALGEIALLKGDHAGAVRELRAAIETCGAGPGTGAGAAGTGTRTDKEASGDLVLLLGGTDPEATCSRAKKSLGLALIATASEKLQEPSARREVQRLADEAAGLGIDAPALAQVFFFRGTAALLEGQDQKATSDLGKALAGSLPEGLVSAARNNFGVALYRSGAVAEARKQFELARAGPTRPAPAVLNLAILHHDAKEAEQALALYDEYLTLGGKRGEDAKKWADAIRKVYR